MKVGRKLHGGERLEVCGKRLKERAAGVGRMHANCGRHLKPKDHVDVQRPAALRLDAAKVGPHASKNPVGLCGRASVQRVSALSLPRINRASYGIVQEHVEKMKKLLRGSNGVRIHQAGPCRSVAENRVRQLRQGQRRVGHVAVGNGERQNIVLVGRRDSHEERRHPVSADVGPDL